MLSHGPRILVNLRCVELHLYRAPADWLYRVPLPGFTSAPRYNEAMTETAKTTLAPTRPQASGESVATSTPPATMPAPARRNNILVMAICAAAIALYGYQVFAGTYNFDIWYLIATGREIVENGIPHENVFSMIDGLRIVVQQWLLCVIYYDIYQVAGFGGISLLVTLAFFATMLILYRIARMRRRDAFGGEWIMLLLLVVMVAVMPQFKMVSTPFSILILSGIVLLLEAYRRDGRWLWLGVIVPIIILHMQLHMSFIVFDLAIIVCYLIPDFLTPFRRRFAKAPVVDAFPREGNGSAKQAPTVAFADAGYRRLPLLVLLVVATLATLLNPYGIDGALYLANSYGAASYGNVIPELRPQTPFAYGLNGIGALLAVLLAAVAIGKAGLRRMDLPGILIFVACVFLGFSSLRNLWMLGLPVVLLAGDAMRGWYIPTVRELIDAVRCAKTRRCEDASVGESLAAGADRAFAAPARMQRMPYPNWAVFLTSVICAAGAGAFALLVALNFSFIDDNAMNDRYTPRALLNAIVRDAEEMTADDALASLSAQPEASDGEGAAANADGNGEGVGFDGAGNAAGSDVSGTASGNADGGIDKGKLRIFNPTVLGGYMEWEGFPVYNDSRVEVWNSAISGLDRELHDEYVDMTLGLWSADQFKQFVEENDFDYLIAEANSPLHAYLISDPEFQNILGTQYYELYKRI